MNKKMREFIWLLARLGAACSVIAVVFVVLSADEGEVKPQEAEADIADFMSQAVFAPRSTTSIVKNSGVTPRAYEVNGQTVYFAVGETQIPPMKVLEYYQTEFVAAGINSKKYLYVPQQKIQLDPKNADKYRQEAHEMITAMNNGEVIPHMATKDYVTMSGPILRGDADTKFKDLFEEWGGQELLKDPNKAWQGWRFIDAQRAENGFTRVTSVWADKDFDFNKFQNANSANLGASEFVPACPGCKLMARSKSLQKEESISFEQYKSPQDAKTVAKFYSKAMHARGWDLAEANHIQEFAASQVPDHPFNTMGPMLTFSKDGRHVTYAMVPDEDGNTVVTAMEEW